MSALGFENGQVAVLASHVDRADDGQSIFYGEAKLIIDLFGLERLDFRNNGELLTVRVFDRTPKEARPG